MCRSNPRERHAQTMSEKCNVDRSSSTFVADYNRMKKIWSERTAWKRDTTGESRADRAYNGLMWSAALNEERWGKMEQTVLEAAQVEYSILVKHALGMPNAPGERPEKQT